MASRFGLRTSERGQEYTDFCFHGDPSNFYMNESHHHASCWAEKAERRHQEDSLKEQLKEMDEHGARLQDMLKSEQAKCTRLQLKCNHQEAELRHRELHSNRLKERLYQLTDRQRAKGPSIEVLNFPPGGRGRREPSTKPLRSTSTKFIERKEEAALRLMLERREAELREAMKLRHSLTTLLHTLRVDMEQTFSNSGERCQSDETSLDQAEAALGEHLTGGVVHSWRDVQKRMCSSDGQTTGSTDEDKILVQKLKESQQLVRLQQELLEDSLHVALPSELTDSYYLEEWERVRMHWAEFDHQRRTFERERQAFTDAAIRLSRERLEFEQHKASLLKQQFLCESPNNASNDYSLGINKSGVNATPASTEMGTATGRAMIKTPTTPEFYAELGLPYYSSEVDHELLDTMTYQSQHTPPDSHLDWSFK